MSEHRYEEIYNYGLLDDLHNLFPEVLYDTYIFPNDTDTNRYISWLRFRLTRMFPQTYRVARIHYMRTQSDANGADFDDWMFLRNRQTARPVSMNTIIESRLLLSALEPILMLPRLRRVAPLHVNLEDSLLFGSFFDSIPVHANSAQIEMASDVLDVHVVAVDTICAICQEHEGSATWRRLRNCDHYFHLACVDNWFGRNAHCPVCRADIRNPPTVATPPHPSTEQNSEAPSVSNPDPRTDP